MRIAIVNDMSLAVESLRRVVNSVPQHHIAWVARNGAEAIKRCAEDLPDLILMDLIMPGMNGAETTRHIMTHTPCPILVVTGSVGGNASLVFEAMGAGALDAVRTPILVQEGEQGAAGLIAKIATIEKLTRITTPRQSALAQVGLQSCAPSGIKLLTIGSSTGGPKALATILSKLPGNFPGATVIIQHVDAQFAGEMAEWLNEKCALPVRLAREGDRPTVGTVLVAGTNDHLVLNDVSRLGYTPIPREMAYRPSVDVFFESVANYWRGGVVGVLLTGMGRDGGAGLLRLRERGHYTIAEHESSCAVYGMPKAAVQLKAAVDVLPVQDIAAALLKVFPSDADKNKRGVMV